MHSHIQKTAFSTWAVDLAGRGRLRAVVLNRQPSPSGRSLRHIAAVSQRGCLRYISSETVCVSTWTSFHDLYHFPPDSLNEQSRGQDTSLTTQKNHAKRIISTLRADSLSHTDFIDASGLTRFSVASKYTLSGDRAYASTLCYLRGTRMSKSRGIEAGKSGHVSSGAGIRERFPEGTRGFLYYFNPDFAPSWMGQLRFRVTDSSDPASFASGHDLLDPHGALPLAWPLRTVMSSSLYQNLFRMLLHEKLVTRDTVAQVAGLWPNLHWKGGTRTIYAYKQPFYLDFQSPRFQLEIVGMEGGRLVVERMKLQGPALHNREYGGDPLSGEYQSQDAARAIILMSYHTGSAICAFDRMPGGEIAVRILKMVEPVKLLEGSISEAGIPQEGALLHTRGGRPWLYKVPSKKPTHDLRWPLRLLKECPGVSWDMF